MAELADALDSGSSEQYAHAGSSPVSRTNQYNPNLFPIGDGFGLFVFFDRYESTYFHNGVQRRPNSKSKKAVWKNWKLQKRNWKPKVSAEFMTFWLHRFRKLDVRQKSHRKMLIDTFINAIFLYDDKMVITFNYKDGTDTITFDDLKTALAGKKTGSDLDCSTAPAQKKL